MSERSSLRGSRLGATSYEDDRGVEFAARQEVAYDCPHGHKFAMTFAAEVEPPAVWECPRCGFEALRVEAQRPDDKPAKPARTHWDMLLERRTVKELEELLAERLELLRAGKLTPDEPVVDNTRRQRRKKTA